MSKSTEPKVVVTKNGCYLVTGGIPLARQTIVANSDGESEKWREGDAFPAQESYALCRCGRSSTKPFCDGTHKKVGFDGTETASRAPYDELAVEIDGPATVLADAESLCAFARFCDAGGNVWSLVSSTDDPEVRKHLSEKELTANFDLDFHLAQVDTIFARVFGSP